MAINLNSPISADLMYQFYDNKAITPQIRAAVQKKQDAADADESKTAANQNSAAQTPASGSKFGPATRVNITDQIIRMNISNNTTKFKKDEEAAKEESKETTAKKPSRYDVLEEVKKSVAEREAAAKAEKDSKLKEIADKVSADEAAKKTAQEEKTGVTP